MHTARIWMASATPGGAPGYDYDKEFGNNITHLAARTSQRLRVYSCQTPEVKGRPHLARFLELSGVPGVRRVGILPFQPCAEGCHLAVSSQPLAASGFTHSNSGSWCRNQVNCRFA